MYYALLESGRPKVIISSDSVVALNMVNTLLGGEVLMYDGSLSAVQKQAVIDSFLNDPERRCLLLSMIAGGEGLNLVPGPTAMIVFSYWFNPAKHRQLEARIHRRGQIAPVDIYNVVSEGTIDEAILQLHEDKARCSTLLLDFESSGAASQSEEWKRFGRIVSVCKRLAPASGVIEDSPPQKPSHASTPSTSSSAIRGLQAVNAGVRKPSSGTLRNRLLNKFKV